MAVLEPPSLESSRYRGTGVKTAVAARRLPRRERTHRRFLPAALSQGTHSYTIEAGDRIDRLAADFFGDARLWWVLTDLNPVTLLDPVKLTPGVEIRVPPPDLVIALLGAYSS